MKPSRGHLLRVAALAVVVVGLIFLVNRSWGLPPLANWLVTGSLLTGVAEAIIQGARHGRCVRGH